MRPYNYVPEKEANYEMNLTAFGVINISLKRCDQSYSTILFCPFFCKLLNISFLAILRDILLK